MKKLWLFAKTWEGRGIDPFFKKSLFYPPFLFELRRRKHKSKHQFFMKKISAFFYTKFTTYLGFYKPSPYPYNIVYTVHTFRHMVTAVKPEMSPVCVFHGWAVVKKGGK